MDDYVPLKGLKRLGPWHAISLSAAEGQLRAITRRVSDSGEEIALVDEEDNIVAVVMNAARLEELETDLSLAQGRVDELTGVQPVPHEEIVKRREEAG